MIKKRIKKSIIIMGVLYLIFVVVVLLNRMPSYTIQTNGTLYIVNKVSRDVQVFDLYTGKEVAEIPIDMQSHEVITTKDEKSIIVTDYGDQTSKGNTIKIINTKTNRIEKVIAIKGSMNANGLVALSDPNKIGLIDYVSNNLAILNLQTNGIEERIGTNQKKSHLAVLHPFDPMVYVTNMTSNSVSAINLNTKKVVKTIPCGLATESIAITPDGSEIWAINKDEDSITIINTKTLEVINTLPTGSEPLKIKCSIDGKYVLVANANEGSISIFDQDVKKEIKKIRIPGKNKFLERILYHTPRPVNILMHPNGLYAFVANSNASKIEVIDMETLEIVSTIGTGKIPDALAFVE